MKKMDKQKKNQQEKTIKKAPPLPHVLHVEPFQTADDVLPSVPSALTGVGFCLPDSDSEKEIQTKHIPLPPIGIHTLKNQNRKKTIGKDGGRIEFEDFNQCYVDFPEGALGEDTSFDLSLLIKLPKKQKVETSDYMVLTPTLVCSPTMTFKEPVTISLPTSYIPSNPNLQVVPQLYSNGNWVNQKPVQHGGKHFIVFKTKSFCRWRIGVPVIGGADSKRVLIYYGFKTHHNYKPALYWTLSDFLMPQQVSQPKIQDEVFRGKIYVDASSCRWTELEIILSFKSDLSQIRVKPMEWKCPLKLDELCHTSETLHIEKKGYENLPRTPSFSLRIEDNKKNVYTTEADHSKIYKPFSAEEIPQDEDEGEPMQTD